MRHDSLVCRGARVTRSCPWFFRVLFTDHKELSRDSSKPGRKGSFPFVLFLKEWYHKKTFARQKPSDFFSQREAQNWQQTLAKSLLKNLFSQGATWVQRTRRIRTTKGSENGPKAEVKNHAIPRRKTVPKTGFGDPFGKTSPAL
jgi:hypothetical protein